MKTGILAGLRIIEGACYVAAPSAATTLSQMGADVIKFDPIGGGIDYRRAPLSKEGKGLYWASMNKGKRSIAINVRDPAGQALIQQLVADSGDDGGIFLTNFSLRGGLSYDGLKAVREDVIYAVVCGDRHGGSQVDYTVNAQVGYPYLTGTPERPVNNVMPGWDLMTGQVTALSILAAERHRRLSGEGQYLQVPLKDVALFAVSSLGLTTEYEVNGVDRPSVGNRLYGAFGRDYATADNKHIMIVGLSYKQWQGLRKATGLAEEIDEIARRRGLDFDHHEEHRFEAHAEIDQLIEPWVASRTVAEIGKAFDANGVCWSVYRSVGEAVEQDQDLSENNPQFRRIDHPELGPFLASTVPMDFGAVERTPPARSPLLGEHTDEILGEVLGMSEAEIGALHDQGIVAGPLERQ